MGIEFHSAHHPASMDPNIRQVACVRCRSKKLKCDKSLPSCHRCLKKGLECMYVLHKKTGPKPHSHAPPVDVDESAKSNGSSTDSWDIMSENTSVSEGSGNLKSFAQPTLNDRRLEKILGLDEIGLTMSDVRKLEEYYFKKSYRPYPCSERRYHAKFAADPLSTICMAYGIWMTGARFKLEYKRFSRKLYKRLVRLMSNPSDPDSNAYSDPITFLWASAMRGYYESCEGREIACTLTIANSARMALLLGLDQIDMPRSVLDRPILTMASARYVNPRFANGLCEDEDNLDPDLPLIEEKRRLFWWIYEEDKWFSYMSWLPSSFRPDGKYTIHTMLPDYNTSGSPQISRFYFEALKKVEEEHMLVDANVPASRFVLCAVFDKIQEWCRIFLTTTPIESIKSEESVTKIRAQIDSFIHYFDTPQGNLLYFDSAPSSAVHTSTISALAYSSITLLYRSILIKLNGVIENELKHDCTGKSIPDSVAKLFTSILLESLTLSRNVVNQFMLDIGEEMIHPPFYVISMNTIQLLVQTGCYIRLYEPIFDLGHLRKHAACNLLRQINDSIVPMGPSSVMFRIRDLLKQGVAKYYRTKGIDTTPIVETPPKEVPVPAAEQPTLLPMPLDPKMQQIPVQVQYVPGIPQPSQMYALPQL